MTTTKKLIWRLANRPTPMEVLDLQKGGILTNEEAREILFSEETEEDRDKKSLEGEIKFLREIVEKLSKGSQSTIIETIRYIEKPYQQYPWYNPYQVWCQAQSLNSQQYTITNSTGLATQNQQAFNSIKTF